MWTLPFYILGIHVILHYAAIRADRRAKLDNASIWFVHGSDWSSHVCSGISHKGRLEKEKQEEDDVLDFSGEENNPCQVTEEQWNLIKEQNKPFTLVLDDTTTIDSDLVVVRKTSKKAKDLFVDAD